MGLEVGGSMQRTEDAVKNILLNIFEGFFK